MLNFKAGLFVTVSLISVAFALDAGAITRVTPISQPILIQSAQSVADADGPTTGGGDTPYLSTKPAQPGAESTKPTETAPAQAATPAPAPDTAATPPPTPAPAEPVKAAEPVAPPTPAPTTPAATEKSQETQVPPAPVQAATPTPQPAPEAPVQAATPPPAAPVTPVPAVVPAPQPINPQIPLQTKTPTPVEAATPEPVTPATPPPAVATQPSQPAPVVGAQDQKPKQQLAKKKPKPVHKPDVVVRNVPHGPVHRVPDDDDMLYADGPVPPLPIGRRHIVIEADNGYDDGYVVVRRYHRCEPHIVSGFWPFHREVRCY